MFHSITAMNNFGDIETKSVSDLEDESFRTISDIKMLTWDAISGGDLMMMVMFQRSAVSAEIDAYLDFLKMNNSRMHNVLLTEDIQDPAEKQIDDELKEEEEYLTKACNTFQEYLGESSSCGWNEINRVRDMTAEMTQQYINIAREKERFLVMANQQSDISSIQSEHVGIILYGLSKQLDDTNNIHNKLKADSDLLIREMDSLNAILAKRKQTPKPKNLDLLYPPKNTTTK
ncbi:uncharacterized protein LOC131432688 [Malaya genurostris]|uniref:uncharacterized protein LOC131432688 n=1 Tax=Malaya genurostris TaxID=325434 RepID=UPI0026F3D2DC|nr:uncharacterized protein LOC131432688 [Malaya genurostris]